MTTYVLLIAILSTDVVTTQTIPGYTTYAKCDTAAKSIQARLRRDHAGKYYVGSITAYCVTGPVVPAR